MTIKISEEEFNQLASSYSGVCLGSCQEVTTDGVEPDARRYLCPKCGERTVYGIEEAVLAGDVEIE